MALIGNKAMTPRIRTKTLLGFALAALVISGLPGSAGPGTGADAARFFPRDKLMEIGVYYYPEHWPEAEWDRDLANIASLGFTFVHMAEFSWAFLEPKDGRFDFGWLDRAVGLAAKHGLKVILGTPTPAPPAWLAGAHPEIFLMDGRHLRKEHGIRANGSTSSPVFRRYSGRVVGEMAKRYGRDKRVWGWQIDNEPGAPVDHGPDAQARFRAWLAKKYGAIESLNETWGTAFWSVRYDSFAQVRIPNAELAGEDKLNPHAVLDHKRFNADETADFLDMQAAELRAAISPAQFLTTNYVSAVDEADPGRTRSLDFPSFTAYIVRGAAGLGPDGFRLGVPYRLAWATDYFRSLAGATGVMELQPGQVNWAPVNPQPMPGAVRMWLWHAFAGGCSFACTYRYRHIPYGSEQYHDGIVGLDGTTLSAGGLQFKQVIGELAGLRAKFDPRAELPPALRARRAALLWDQENLWDLEEQKQTLRWNTRRHAEKLFAALKSCGAPVDIVPATNGFSGYAVVVAPAFQLVDEALVAKWRAYAEGGGHLILTCRTGQKDKAGRMWSGKFSQPVTALIGADIAFYDMLLEDGRGRVSLTGGRDPFLWNNWADILSPAAGTETLAAYADQFYAGKAAATYRRLGKGSVTYIGVDTEDGRLEREIVRRVYVRAGIPIADLPGGVYVEWRHGFFAAVNYSSAPFDLPLPSGAAILIGDRRLEPADVCVWTER
jgi:beta-galactosidase